MPKTERRKVATRKDTMRAQRGGQDVGETAEDSSLRRGKDFGSKALELERQYSNLRERTTAIAEGTSGVVYAIPPPYATLVVKEIPLQKYLKKGGQLSSLQMEWMISQHLPPIPLLSLPYRAFFLDKESGNLTTTPFSLEELHKKKPIKRQDRALCLVYRKYQTDMKTFLTEKKRIDPRMAVLIGSQILFALYYLHINGIVYRGLRPKHVLMDKGGWVALSNLNLAECIDTSLGVCKNCNRSKDGIRYCPKNTKKRSYVSSGAPLYMAPLVISPLQRFSKYGLQALVSKRTNYATLRYKGGKLKTVIPHGYTYDVDLWSFAVVFWVLWTGDPDKLFEGIFPSSDCRRPPFQACYSSSLDSELRRIADFQNILNRHIANCADKKTQGPKDGSGTSLFEYTFGDNSLINCPPGSACPNYNSRESIMKVFSFFQKYLNLDMVGPFLNRLQNWSSRGGKEEDLQSQLALVWGQRAAESVASKKEQLRKMAGQLLEPGRDEAEKDPLGDKYGNLGDLLDPGKSPPGRVRFESQVVGKALGRAGTGQRTDKIDPRLQQALRAEDAVPGWKL